MDSFLKDVTSTSWWVGVVMVGIIINLVSPIIGNLLGRSSLRLLASWRGRSEAQRERISKRARAIRTSEVEQVLAATDEVNHLIRAVICLGVAGAVSLCAVLVPVRDGMASWVDVMVRTTGILFSAVAMGAAVRQLLLAEELSEARSQAFLIDAVEKTLTAFRDAMSTGDRDQK